MFDLHLSWSLPACPVTVYISLRPVGGRYLFRKGKVRLGDSVATTFHRCRAFLWLRNESAALARKGCCFVFSFSLLLLHFHESQVAALNYPQAVIWDRPDPSCSSIFTQSAIGLAMSATS